MAQSNRISLRLTQEQRDAVKAACGKDAEVLEWTAEELEQRIAPMKVIHTKLGPYA